MITCLVLGASISTSFAPFINHFSTTLDETEMTGCTPNIGEIVIDEFGDWSREYDSAKTRDKVLLYTSDSTNYLYLNLDGEIHESVALQPEGGEWDGKKNDIWGTTTMGSWDDTYEKGVWFWAQKRVTDWYVMYFKLKFENPDINKKYFSVQYEGSVGFHSLFNKDGQISVSNKDGDPEYYDLSSNNRGYTKVGVTIPRDSKIHDYTISHSFEDNPDPFTSAIGDSWGSEVWQVAWRHQKNLFDDGTLLWDYASVKWQWLEYYHRGFAESPAEGYSLSGGDFKFLKAIIVNGAFPNGVDQNLIIQYQVKGKDGVWPGANDWSTTLSGVPIDKIGTDVRIKLTLKASQGTWQGTPKINKISLIYEDLPPEPTGLIPDITIPVYDYDQETDTWYWDDRSIALEPALGVMYVGSELTTTVQIANAWDWDIEITSASVSLTCDEFENGPAPLDVFSGAAATIGGLRNPQESVTFQINREHFNPRTWDNWVTTPIVVVFEFSGTDSQTGTSFGPIADQYEITVSKPPEPRIEFLGFVDDEFGEFEPTYKPDGQLNSFFAQVKIINFAYVPLHFCLDFEYEQTPPYNNEKLIQKLAITDYPVSGYDTLQPHNTPGDRMICNLPLDVTPLGGHFFVQGFEIIDVLLGGLDLGGNVLDLVAEIIQKFGQAAELVEWLSNTAKVFAWASIIWSGIEMAVAGVTSALDTVRPYKFTVEVQGEYEIRSGVNIDYVEFHSIPNVISVPGTEPLVLKPAQWQWNRFTGGMVSKGVALAASITSQCFGQFSLIGLIAWAVSIVADLTGGALWDAANGDIVPDPNYEEVVTPIWPNLTHPEPTNTFEYALYKLYNDTYNYKAIYDAYNTTLSRRKGAIDAGDNESIVLQDKALINYTTIATDHLEELDEDLAIFTNEFEKVGPEVEENISQFITEVSEGGLPEDIRENLNESGLSDSQIDELDLYIKNRTRNELGYTGANNTIFDFIGNLSKLSQGLDNQTKEFNKLKETVIEESVIIETTDLGEEITTADEETLSELENLKSTSYTLAVEGNWASAYSKAKSLKDLALETISTTRNTTYQSYIEDAKVVIDEYEEMVKIKLITYQDLISVRPGDDEEIEIIILSTGSPTGTYTLSSSSSWILPQSVEFEVQQFDSSSIILKVGETIPPTTSPGTYPIELLLQKEGIDIQKLKTLEIRIPAFSEIALSIDQTNIEVNPGEVGTYQLQIQNAGNIPNTLDLEFVAIDIGSEFEAEPSAIDTSWVFLEPQNVVLTPGQIEDITLEIEIPPDWQGMESTSYRFKIRAISQEIPDQTEELEASLTVHACVENMFSYVSYEIADLEDEVDERVSILFDWLILGQLNRAESILVDALTAYEDDLVSKSVVLDKLAKLNIELSDIITIILDWIGFISEVDGDFISNYLHKIRDHITLIMGATIGTNEAIEIAQIETEIEQLADKIFDDYQLSVSLPIDVLLWVASENLDWVLFWMAEGCYDLAENFVILSISELDCTKSTINQFKDNMDIPEEDAELLIQTIEILISKLTIYHSHLSQEGAAGGAIPTHQGTNEGDGVGGENSSETGGQTENPIIEIPSH